MLTSHLFPFYSLSNYQLHNEFQSIKEKLEEVINNSVLSDFFKFLKPYYHQVLKVNISLQVNSIMQQKSYIPNFRCFT